MLVVPFKLEHVLSVSDEDAIEGKDWGFELEVLRELERHNSWTLLDTNGDVVACAGTIEHWRNRHECWVFMTKRAARCMRRLTRLVEAFLDPLEGRIEATVRADFEAGHRWLKMLGFHVETPCLVYFGPDGADHTGYVRFNFK